MSVMSAPRPQPTHLTARPSLFGERLGYLRWLHGCGSLTWESDRQFAERAQLNPRWLFTWKRRPDAPVWRPIIKKLLLAFESLRVTEAWLIDATGEPPAPEVWAYWIAHTPEGQCTATSAYRPRKLKDAKRVKPVNRSRPSARRVTV